MIIYYSILYYYIKDTVPGVAFMLLSEAHRSSYKGTWVTSSWERKLPKTDRKTWEIPWGLPDPDSFLANEEGLIGPLRGPRTAGEVGGERRIGEDPMLESLVEDANCDVGYLWFIK